MLGRTLDTKIVEEMREARTGGEYAACLAFTGGLEASGDRAADQAFCAQRKPDHAAPLLFGDGFLTASKTKYQAIIS